MKRRLSIRTRLTLWHIGLLALSLIGFSLALYAALSDQLYRSLDERLRVEAGAAFDDVLRRAGPDFGGGGRPTDFPAQYDFSARLIDPSGHIVNAAGLLSAVPIDSVALDQARQQNGALRTITLADDQQARVYALPLLRDGQVIDTIEVAELLNVTEAALRSLALILLVAVPATLALAAFGGWFIADRSLRPIAAITHQAKRISEQDLHRRLNLDLSDDEVGQLARTFDAMLDRLEAAFQRQRQFTADASHELRTPLTVIKTNIGVTLNRPRSVKQYQIALEQVEDEVDRLTRLTSDLLLLARADASQPVAQQREIDLAPIGRGICDDLKPLAESNDLALNFSAPERARTRGDPDQLYRVFFNLIENAIKYTAQGSVSVSITSQSALTSTPHPIRIAIEDTGPGIAAEDLPHLFERFYRVDAARSREQGGSGLGLAIAHSIVTAHGGTIEVSSEVRRGTTITVTLPGL
jgi:heavy metal sensor kinase